MGSDGASNMTGSKGGLATLLRKDFPEMINVHCFCHRLELSFRDAMKSTKLYEKMMTLLTGLYYFYTKSSKQKKALQEAMTALCVKGTFPPRVTGISLVYTTCNLSKVDFDESYNNLYLLISTGID